MQSKLMILLFTFSAFSAAPIISMAHQDDIALMRQPRAGKTFIAKAIAGKLDKSDPSNQRNIQSGNLRTDIIAAGNTFILGSFAGILINKYRGYNAIPKVEIITTAMVGLGTVAGTYFFTTPKNFVTKTLGWRAYDFVKNVIIGSCPAWEEKEIQSIADAEQRLKTIKLEPRGIIGSCINYFKGESSHENH